MTNDELKSRMDRIIEWVKTCDTKASIMLTLVCLISSFIFTSDFVLNGLIAVVRTWREYKCENSCFNDINIPGVLSVASSLLTLYFVFGSIYRFVMVLYSKIDESLIDNNLKKITYKLFNAFFCYSPCSYNLTGIVSDSLIHFNHISKMSFADFKGKIENNAEGNDNASNSADLISQIYINACRCREKFDDYNAAIKWMLYSIPSLVVLFVSLIYFQTGQATT